VVELVLAVGLVGVAIGAISRVRGRAAEERVVALTFPRGLRAEQAVDALRALTGLLPPWWRRLFGAPAVVFDVVGMPAGIEHLLTVPAARAEFVLGALRAALPGLRVSDMGARPSVPIRLARELRCSGSGRLRTEATLASNANLLAALQPLRFGERVTAQYVVTPLGASRLGLSLARLAELLWTVRQEETAARAEPDFAVALRVGVAADRDGRARQLMTRVLGAFHSVGTAEAHLSRRALPSLVVANRIATGAPPDRGAVVLGADELAAVLGVPLESPQLPGLTLAGSRELPPESRVPHEGLVLGDSTVAGVGRPVALSLDEARRGLHVCAPTGAGKSTLLCGLACQLMAGGYGLVLIDSKGDLAADVADRVPEDRRGDVVVFDPADRAPVGFNVIGGSEEAELVVDHVVGQFRARYGVAGLGPRSEDILRAALLTLSTEPTYTICEVEPLLTNAAFRQRLVGRLDEPALEGFWAWFGSLSEAARAEAVAPLANKLRTYTLRRRVRAVVGQSDGLDLARVLAEGRVLIVSLAKGLVGVDAAALIGAAMTARLWATIQARAALPPSGRRPAWVICDEFQDFAALPLSFGEAIAQSRGYGVGWVLAHQHLAQLDAATRQAVLANCRSRLVMQTSAQDAAAFARELAPHVEAADLQGLGPFEGYASVSVGASVAPPASLHTRPAPPALGSAADVRAGSRKRYGRSPTEVDRAIRERVLRRRPSAPVGGARRRR
jgi:hypothetical protein